MAASQDAYQKLEQDTAAPRSAGAQLIISADLNLTPLKAITNPSELNSRGLNSSVSCLKDFRGPLQRMLQVNFLFERASPFVVNGR